MPFHLYPTSEYIKNLYSIIRDIKILTWVTEQFKLEENNREFSIKLLRFGKSNNKDNNNNKLVEFNEVINNVNRGKWFTLSYGLKGDKDINLSFDSLKESYSKEITLGYNKLEDHIFEEKKLYIYFEN